MSFWLLQNTETQVLALDFLYYYLYNKKLENQWRRITLTAIFKSYSIKEESQTRRT